MSVILWLGIAVLGVLLAYLLYQDWTFLSGRRRRVMGTVVGHQSSIDDGATYYSPKVRFETVDGRTIEIVDTYGTASKRLAVGAPLDVVYPIDAPERGRVPRPGLRLVIYAFVLGMLGVLAGLVAGWLK